MYEETKLCVVYLGVYSAEFCCIVRPAQVLSTSLTCNIAPAAHDHQQSDPKQQELVELDS